MEPGLTTTIVVPSWSSSRTLTPCWAPPSEIRPLRLVRSFAASAPSVALTTMPASGSGSVPLTTIAASPIQPRIASRPPARSADFSSWAKASLKQDCDL